MASDTESFVSETASDVTSSSGGASDSGEAGPRQGGGGFLDRIGLRSAAPSEYRRPVLPRVTFTWPGRTDIMTKQPEVSTDKTDSDAGSEGSSVGGDGSEKSALQAGVEQMIERLIMYKRNLATGTMTPGRFSAMVDQDLKNLRALV